MPETVRAKFRCTSMTKVEDWSHKQSFQWSYKMSPVTSGSEENANFYKYTPSGGLDLVSISAELFEVGKEYYLDFTPAPV